MADEGDRPRDAGQIDDARPSAIGGYEDWPAWFRGRPLLDGDDTTGTTARLLGVPAVERPTVRTVRTWEADGLTVDEVEWWVGSGPPTRAWALRPTATDGPLPGVLALHCHAGVKSIGAERLVRTPEPTAVAERLRRELYGGRALAEELARAGFIVLAHDTFAWGSRRFLLGPLPVGLRETARRAEVTWAADGVEPDDHTRYDAVAAAHEHVVAKAAGMLGTSFAGMVAHDDLVALAVLRSLPGVDPDQTGVVGFSGGGGRAATLVSLDPGIRAAAVVGMMTTTDALFPAHADAHSWLLTTPGLLGTVGLPEIAAARRAHHLLTLSFADDPLFPADGVRAAFEQLDRAFAGPGATGSYRGVLLPGGHVFTPEAQDIVRDFVVTSLVGGPPASLPR